MVPYDAVRAPKLIAEAYEFWMLELLPRFVMRDNGELDAASINPKSKVPSIIVDMTEEAPCTKKTRTNET
jgi:hypothetical protein